MDRGLPIEEILWSGGLSEFKFNINNPFCNITDNYNQDSLKYGL
jgi:hypothetical protein